jgi:hypothetical protein
MNKWTVRLGLSLMVVVGLWTSRAPAQQYIPPPDGPVFIVPVTPYEPEHRPYGPTELSPRPAPAPAKHAVTRVLNHYGLGCQADSFACCGSAHSEFHWVFGSCRTFFGETCYPNQGCTNKGGGCGR